MNPKNTTTEEMGYNRITLSFPEKNEILFRKKYFIDSLTQLRLALILLIILYGLFGFLDVEMFPKYASIFHIIRYLIVIPIILLVFLFSFTKLFKKIWQVLLLISFIIAGSGIGVMTMFEPENYAYYAGLMLIFSAGYFFIKLRFFLATIAGWTTLFIFNFIAIVYADAPSIVLISNNFFFISANLIGMFGSYSIEHQIRRNFLLNQNLDAEKLYVQELNKNLGNTVEDRTKELVKEKEKAEASNANITAVIEGTTNSIWAFNRNHEILYINQVFQKDFYHSFGVYLEPGVSLIKSLPEPLISLWKPRYDRVLANEQFVVEDAIDTAAGIIYINVGFNPIVKNGKVIGGSCFGSNITSRKLSEIELVKTREMAVESDRLKSAFLANMSHEIRTPMNGILGFSELLKTPNLSGSQQQKYIRIIEKSGKRMLNIINDIVDISKIEAGLMKVDITESDVNEQIEYIYTFSKPEVEAKGLTLLFKNNLRSKEVIIKTDREKLFAILTNLVKNAIKYTSEGSIEFGYDRKGNSLEFYVKDTGIGIPINRQEAIFERFIQADIADKMAHQGAGLGLSITKAYLGALGGKIWVESQEGAGSTFYFTLPYNAVKKELLNRDNELISNKSTGYKPYNSTGLKILIVEDDEISSSLISIAVENISSEIIKAENGLEAIEACRKNPDIDLILMDIKMPVLDGYGATQQIRLFNKDVIIIAQTAYGLVGDREKALAVGCNDYISKPINDKLLLLIIQKYFN